jgi:phosphoribosylaminoimidazole carboxylase PurE protein
MPDGTDSKTPMVMILMGSDSDLPVMKGALEVLGQFQVSADVEITSAHRTPDRTREIVKDSPASIFIVGAGGAAHLAGTVAALTPRPVLGVPLAATTLGGLDALLSTVQMPAGIPVPTLAIGEAGARNAALAAVAILALNDAALADRLDAFRRDMAAKVEAKSARVRQALASSSS